MYAAVNTVENQTLNSDHVLIFEKGKNLRIGYHYTAERESETAQSRTRDARPSASVVYGSPKEVRTGPQRTVRIVEHEAVSKCSELCLHIAKRDCRLQCEYRLGGGVSIDAATDEVARPRVPHVDAYACIHLE